MHCIIFLCGKGVSLALSYELNVIYILGDLEIIGSTRPMGSSPQIRSHFMFVAYLILLLINNECWTVQCHVLIVGPTVSPSTIIVSLECHVMQKQGL